MNRKTGLRSGKWHVCWLVVLAIGSLTQAGVPTTGGNGEGAPCVFPFVYEGSEQFDCLLHKTHSWCATSANYDKDHKWGICPPMNGEVVSKDREKKDTEKSTETPHQKTEKTETPQKKTVTEAPKTDPSTDIPDTDEETTKRNRRTTTSDTDEQTTKRNRRTTTSDTDEETTKRNRRTTTSHTHTIKDAASKARAKMKKLLEKGAKRLAKITAKAVKALVNEKWTKFKKLVKDMKKETGKFAHMRLKEAKEFAAKARKNFMRKMIQAKKAAYKARGKINQGMKKAKKKMKEFFQKVTNGKNKPGPAKQEKPSWEKQLEEGLATLRLMPDGEAKQAYADQLTGDIIHATDKAALQTSKTRELLNKVQEALMAKMTALESQGVRPFPQAVEGDSATDHGACREKPCLKGACKVTASGGYICICIPGYMGRLCEVLGNPEEDAASPAPIALATYPVVKPDGSNLDLGNVPVRGPPLPLVTEQANMDVDGLFPVSTTTADPFVKAGVVVANKPEDAEDKLENLEGRPESKHPANEEKSLMERFGWAQHKNKIFGAIGIVGCIGLLAAIICITRGASRKPDYGSVEVYNTDENTRLLRTPTPVIHHEHEHERGPEHGSGRDRKHKPRHKKSKDRRHKMAA